MMPGREGDWILWKFRSGTNSVERSSARRSHHSPFTTAPVADSQRSSGPLLFTN